MSKLNIDLTRYTKKDAEQLARRMFMTGLASNDEATLKWVYEHFDLFVWDNPVSNTVNIQFHPKGVHVTYPRRRRWSDQKKYRRWLPIPEAALYLDMSASDLEEKIKAERIATRTRKINGKPTRQVYLPAIEEAI